MGYVLVAIESAAGVKFVDGVQVERHDEQMDRKEAA